MTQVLSLPSQVGLPSGERVAERQVPEAETTLSSHLACSVNPFSKPHKLRPCKGLQRCIHSLESSQDHLFSGHTVKDKTGQSLLQWS